MRISVLLSDIFSVFYSDIFYYYTTFSYILEELEHSSSIILDYGYLKSFRSYLIIWRENMITIIKPDNIDNDVSAHK